MISTADPTSLPRALFESALRYRAATLLERVRVVQTEFLRLRCKTRRFDALKAEMWRTIDEANAQLSELAKVAPREMNASGWRTELMALFERSLEHRIAVDPEG